MGQKIFLGPFIGASDSSVIVSFETRGNLDLKIKLSSATLNIEKNFSSNEEGIATVKLDGLAPGTNHTYQIIYEGELLENGSGKFKTFPAKFTRTDFKFAFYSCHKPYYEYRERFGIRLNGLLSFLGKKKEEFKPESMVIWEYLNKLISDEAYMDDSPEFVMGIGDQVYLDDIWEIKNIKKTDLEFKTRQFRRFYYKYLNFDSIRSVFANCPSYFIWDDHEIKDGWGSDANWRIEPGSFEHDMFLAASQTYNDYQFSHNPFRLTQNYLDNKYYYSFVYGEAGFLVLDLRGQRNASKESLLGEEQWEYISSQLDILSERCKLVFIICSVPFQHIKENIVSLQNYGLPKKILKLAGLLDDFIDQWNSPYFKKDAVRFASKLQDISLERNTKFYLLGGDVHVATFSHLDSKRMGVPLLYQFTSSPISNKPTTVAVNLKRLAKKLDFEEVLGFTGYLKEVVARRNIGIVDIKYNEVSENYNVEFQLHHARSNNSIRIRKYQTDVHEH